MSDLHTHNYYKWWKSGQNQLIPWPLVDDDHLKNIKCLLIKKGFGPKEMNFEFPDMAFYFCMKEIKKRNKHNWITELDDHHFNRIKTAIYDRAKTRIKEHNMRTRYETFESNDSVLNQTTPSPTFTLEDLTKLFGKKVKILGKNKTGKVVGIYHPDYPRTSINQGYNLKVSDESGSMHQLQFGDVEVIQEVQLYLYEHKTGNVEWTSKAKPAAWLKRNKIKLLTTKMIEV